MTGSSTVRRILFSRSARRVWTLAALVLTGVVLYLALSPSPMERPSSGWDKVDHVLAFLALALCGHFAWRGRPGAMVWLVAGLVTLGIGIEIAQRQVPGRSADWQDVLADTLGIALGLMLATALASAFDRRRVPRTDQTAR